MYDVDTSNGLSMREWCLDNTVYCYEINETPVEPGVLEPKPDSGYLKTAFTLGAPPTENFQMWVFASYYSVVRISTDLVVGMDHAASAPS